MRSIPVASSPEGSRELSVGTRGYGALSYSLLIPEPFPHLFILNGKSFPEGYPLTRWDKNGLLDPIRLLDLQMLGVLCQKPTLWTAGFQWLLPMFPPLIHDVHLDG